MFTAVLVTQSLSNPPTPVILSPPLRATLHASYHRDVRDLRSLGDDQKALPIVFGGVLDLDSYPLTPANTPLIGPDDWGNHLVSGSQQGAHGYLSTCTQLNNCCPGPTELLSPSSAPVVAQGYNLQAYCNTVGLDDDPTYGTVYPDCHCGPPLQLSVHPTDLAPGDMCGCIPLGIAIPGGPPIVF